MGFIVCFLSCLYPEHNGSKHYILYNRFMREQVEMLENHTHFATQKINIGFFIGNVYSLKPNLSACRYLKQIQTTQKRAFATSRRADDNNFLALFYIEVNPLQYLQIVGEFFTKTLNGYHLREASFQEDSTAS